MKNWSNLDKDDILYLYIPMSDDVGRIFYKKQESKVISTKLYQDLVTYIKFKYTDIRGKRHRINLGVNRIKYNQKVVSTENTTEYAREFPLKYGNFLVSYLSFEEIEKQIKEIKTKRIETLYNKIDELNNEINFLRNEI